MLISFFVITFLWSWLFWLPLTTSVQGGVETSISLGTFALIGNYGPTIAAGIMVSYRDGWKGPGSLISQLVSGELNWIWTGIAIFGIALIQLTAIMLHMYLGGPPVEYPAIAVWSVLPFFFIVGLLGAPLGEELGWRGFALPLLQCRFSALQASIILGAIWGVWHAPLMMTTVTHHNMVSAGLFIGRTIPISILFTWLYNSTKGNLLVALLFHGAINTWSLILPIPTPDSAGVFIISALLLWMIAIAVAIITGPATLSARGQTERSQVD